MISAPLTRREIILGKTIPYIVLGMVNLPILVGMAHFVFHVPVRGSLVLMALSTLVFVWVTVAVGALIGTISRTQQQAFMLSFLFIFPGTLMSGVFFPFETMPKPLKAIAYCNPLTHYLPLLRNILLKGGEPSMVAWHLSVLIVMGLLVSGVTFRYMHTTLE
jgi:ABC-2 type transport system permease protein